MGRSWPLHAGHYFGCPSPAENSYVFHRSRRRLLARPRLGQKDAQAPAALPGYLDAAVRAARWIRTARVETPAGYLWLTGPERPEGLDSTPNLYSGSSGIVLFLLELARATGDKAYREEAAAGADHLIATLPAKADPEKGRPASTKVSPASALS